MRAIAASIAKLPPGQLKKVLTDDIIAILAKYGVVIEWRFWLVGKIKIDRAMMSCDGSDTTVK